MSRRTQNSQVRQEDSKDLLVVMIEQEDKFYRCRNFLSIERMDGESSCHSPLHVVEECASLVTDVPQPAPESPTNSNCGLLQGHLVRSPVLVTRFPPPTDSSLDSQAGLLTSSQPGSIHDNHGNPLSPRASDTLMRWRRQMLEWAYGLASTYFLDREVVAMAFHLMDRYIASEVLSTDPDVAGTPLDQEDVQLYSMVCLYIAIKAFVPYRKLTVDCIMDMSRGFYTEEHIIESELEILTALDWRVNQPTVMDYCRLYWNLFPKSVKSKRMNASCQHLAELALDNAYFISKPHYLIALAAVLLAAQRLGVSVADANYFLANVQELVTGKTVELDVLLRRLESIC